MIAVIGHHRGFTEWVEHVLSIIKEKFKEEFACCGDSDTVDQGQGIRR